MSSLRIALVQVADSGGGAERSVLTLHNSLRRQGHDCRLFVGTKNRDDEAVFEIEQHRPIPGVLRITRRLERIGIQNLYAPWFRRLPDVIGEADDGFFVFEEDTEHVRRFGSERGLLEATRALGDPLSQWLEGGDGCLRLVADSGGVFEVGNTGLFGAGAHVIVEGIVSSEGTDGCTPVEGLVSRLPEAVETG